MQKTGGLYKLLHLSACYTGLQLLVGARRSWQRFAHELVRAQAGTRVLDIGCGTGDILEYLPEGVHYTGIDLSADYIAAARVRWGARGEFLVHHGDWTASENLPPCDVAMAVGVLHHVDDALAVGMLTQVAKALGDSGRFVSLDPCFNAASSRASTFLMKRDRGCHVRSDEAYIALAESCFAQVTTHLEQHRYRIPYTHLSMECTQALAS